MEAITEKKLIVGQYISVSIDDLLPDLILVSYQHQDSKIFQGILLDSTKRKVPCGSYRAQDQQKPLEEDGQTSEVFDDRLYSVSQRHSYNASNNVSKNKRKPKPIAISKTKSSRMTVRLRPRQVLCSNCQSICNEKSENVGPIKSSNSKEICSSNVGLLQKNSNGVEKKPGRETRQNFAVNEFPCLNGNVNSSPAQNAVLIPKLIKLKAIDIETATNVFSKSKSGGDANVNVSEVLVSNTEIGNIDKIPTLKLSSAKKGKIPKMTISTSSVLISSTISDKCGIRTRSKGSIEEKVLGLHASLSEKYEAASKVVLSSTNSLFEGNEKQDMKSVNLLNNLGMTYSESTCKSSKDCGIGRDINSFTSMPSISENLPQANISNIVFLPISLSTHSDSSDCSLKSDKMNLRKKRSVGSMEDLWDETVFDEAKKIKVASDESADCSVELETNVDSEKPKTTPVLKISFGPGKGTVLKIPAKSTVSENDPLNDVEQAEPPKEDKLSISKAARKALKRARKEAQRKAIGIASSLKITGKVKFSVKSPMTLGGMSPARFSGFSPGRFGGVSPGRFSGSSPGRLGCSSPGRLGCSSPGRFGGASPARLGALLLSPRTGKDSIFWSQTRRHKHKVKHKKKHKEHKHKSSDENVEPNTFPIDVPPGKEIEPFTESTNVNVACSPGSDKTPENSPIWKIPTSPHQETSPRHTYLQNTRHKLSISIKRVSNASYIACEPSDQKAKIQRDLQACGNDTITLSDASDLEDKLIEDHDKSETYKPMGLNCNFLNISPERDTGSDHSQSSDDNLEVPNFPYIVSKTGWLESEGCEPTTFNFKTGDVVWGKIQDFPWWPAKVVFMRISEEMCSSEPNYQQAQVNWYGTNATSLIPAMTLQPFLKQFNVIFNKRKRGQYLKAVRQASCEAQQIIEDNDQMVTNICESPITASPREVDVVS